MEKEKKGFRKGDENKMKMGKGKGKESGRECDKCRSVVSFEYEHAMAELNTSVHV